MRNSIRRGRTRCLVAILCCLTFDLRAAETAGGDGQFDLASLGATGSIRAAYWSSNRRFDNDRDIGVASAWLKMDRRFESGIGLFAEGYVANEDVFDSSRDTSRVREFYIEARKGSFDVRLGSQIIAWGRADRLNPTDNLTPRDFTLLVTDTDEDRFGSLAAKMSWNFDAGVSLTGVWLPRFRPNVIAIPAYPGISFEEHIPDSRRQWAMKLDRSGGTVDWSVSWFDGFDLTADYSRGTATASGLLVNLHHHRIKVFGLDAVTTVGAYRFAFEAAHVRTEDSNGDDPAVKNPFVYGVLGVERSFAGDLTLITQYFDRRVLHYQNPETISDPTSRLIAVQHAVANFQYDRIQQGISLRLAKRWLNDTVEGELAGVRLFKRAGYSLRPKLTYTWSDEIKLVGGYEYFGGSESTVYGKLEKNKTLFLETRYYF